MRSRARVAAAFFAGLIGCAVVAGCTRKGEYQPLGMWNDARMKPMEGAAASRRPPAGTIARGQPRADSPLLTGRDSAGEPAAVSPVPITPDLLARGQERFNVFCSPCHGRSGDGQGMIVRRGFPHPPDYAIPRLREARLGHFFDVMTNGYGVMYSYAERVPPADRWAIAAYIRVLQKARPVVHDDPYEAERERAREEGIPDPARPESRLRPLDSPRVPPAQPHE